MPQTGERMGDADVSIEAGETGRRVRFAGPVAVGELDALRARLTTLPGAGPVTIDLAGAGAMDTAGAWLIATLRRRLAAEGVETRLEGADAKQALLIETVERALPPPDAPTAPRGGFLDWVERVGRATAEGVATTRDMIAFGGEIVARFVGAVARPWRFPFTSLVHHMQDVGLNAVPIVALMAFLIGVVLAFMGSVQLRQFGAEVFVVDLIAITVLRVLGVLMAAIIVAGRTASAYTAAIGSMKLREEIDAMRTLGLDPIEVLVLPRVLALVITLPLLGFLAGVAGLVGGAVMAWIELGISPSLFAARLTESGDRWNFLVGMIQAPFFAAIIGLVGCYEGMQVEKSAESLGQRTSDSVVLAIFLVIVTTAAFSVFFMQLGV
jgi:phospholipid/cholesterol/gamma-HCH transport system permease protein